MNLILTDYFIFDVESLTDYLIISCMCNFSYKNNNKS